MDEAEGYAAAKTLFLEASGLPRGERTRFLKERCGGDGALEGRVRRLLTLEEEGGEFLEGAAVERGGRGVEPGARLGPFRILRVLGEGGMGVVYEAQQEEPERRVALKLVRQGFFSERLRARFRHEIRVLGHLRHPGVAQIYEAGTLVHAGEHVPYFAMELVEGEPLLEYGRGLGVRERLALLAQICDAVHHAHQKGVIHRDLKPANILVEPAATEGGTGESGTALPFQVKVLDFGVARAIDTDIAVTSAHTQAGQLIGTLAYMSPEQAAGDADAVDVRSDVYSIGVIACELLVGRLPYEVEGKSLPEAARVIGEQEPVRLSVHDRSLRGDVETIVRKALAKDRRMRYQSAAELAADIRRSLRDEPIVARPASALYQLRKFARRHKTLVCAAGIVMAAMLAATVVSTWQARVAERARVFAEGEQKRADMAAGAATREANRATLAGAAAAIASGDPITASRMLDRTPEPHRGWAWRYWHARLDESVAMARVPGAIGAAWMSADGARIAVLTMDGVVYRGSCWSGEMSEAAHLAETPLRLATFVDQGRRIITDGPHRRTLTLFDATDGRVIHRHDALEAAIGVIEASADGRCVLVGPRRPGRAPGDVLWLLKATEPSAGWTGDRVSISGGTECAAITRDGRWLALGRGNEAVMTWDAEASEPRDLTRAPRGAQTVAVSDDGALIATGGVDKTINLWDRATGKLIHSLAGHAGTVTALAFDPAGGTVASAGVDLTIRLWDTARGQAVATFIGQTGHVESRQFIGPAGPAVCLQFSADGSLLMSASRDGTIRLWRREPFEGACILRGHTGYVYAVAFSPDGARILSGAWDGTVRVWDGADGRPLGAAPSGAGYITALGVSPDGRRIATGHKPDGTGWTSTITLWDAATTAPVGSFSESRGEISDLLFSADGSRLYASRENNAVDECDLTKSPPARRELATGAAPDSIALSPGGEELACGHVNGSISISALPSGDVTRRLQGHTNRVRGVAFHPTRRLLASASDDGTARLWDLGTGRALELRGHADKVYCVAFSPDGRVLATGSEDTTIVLWDIAEGGGEIRADELTRLRGHEAYVYSLAFSPDGTRLVSGSGDHTVRVWDTRPLHERYRSRREH